MPRYDFNVYGVNRVQNSLRKLVSLHAEVLDPVVRTWAQSARKKLKSTPYPPQPATSKYVRTGNLANRFAVEQKGIAHYWVSNRASYGSFVIGDNAGPLKQAWMHAGRWWQMRPIIESELPGLRQAIEKAIDDL